MKSANGSYIEEPQIYVEENDERKTIGFAIPPGAPAVVHRIGLGIMFHMEQEGGSLDTSEVLAGLSYHMGIALRGIPTDMYEDVKKQCFDLIEEMSKGEEPLMRRN